MSYDPQLDVSGTHIHVSLFTARYLGRLCRWEVELVEGVRDTAVERSYQQVARIASGWMLRRRGARYISLMIPLAWGRSW